MLSWFNAAAYSNELRFVKSVISTKSTPRNYIASSLHPHTAEQRGHSLPVPPSLSLFVSLVFLSVWIEHDHATVVDITMMYSRLKLSAVISAANLSPVHIALTELNWTGQTADWVCRVSTASFVIHPKSKKKHARFPFSSKIRKREKNLQ